jgi:hypothetical protein
MKNGLKKERKSILNFEKRFYPDFIESGQAKTKSEIYHGF